MFFPSRWNIYYIGKFSSLNDYVAQPSFDQLKLAVDSSNSCRSIFDLEGGNSIEKIGEKWIYTEGKMNRFDSKEIAISRNKNFIYIL